jgi:hypothetical protein
VNLTTPPPASPVLLTYADPPAQLGVTVLRESDAVYVIVPPPCGLRMFFTWHLAVLLIFGLLIVVGISERKFFPLPSLAFPVVLGHYAYTFWRRRVFMVSPDHVKFGCVGGGGYLWQHEWPRSEIGEVKMNRYNGKLLIRVTGKDMQEYFISSNPAITQYVADMLNSNGSGEAVC